MIRYAIYKMEENGICKLLKFTISRNFHLTWMNLHMDKTKAIRQGFFVDVVKKDFTF